MKSGDIENVMKVVKNFPMTSSQVLNEWDVMRRL